MCVCVPIKVLSGGDGEVVSTSSGPQQQVPSLGLSVQQQLCLHTGQIVVTAAGRARRADWKVMRPDLVHWARIRAEHVRTWSVKPSFTTAMTVLSWTHSLFLVPRISPNLRFTTPRFFKTIQCGFRCYSERLNPSAYQIWTHRVLPGKHLHAKAVNTF